MKLRFPLVRTALFVAPLCMAPALAQSPPETPQEPVVEAEPTGDPAAQVQTIIGEYDGKMEAFYELYQNAEDDAAREKLYGSYPQAGPYVERLKTIIEQAPENPAAVTAIVWILSNSEARDQRAGFLALLLKHHMASDEIAQVCGLLRGDPSIGSETFLRKLIDASTSHETVGFATFALSGMLDTRAYVRGQMNESSDDGHPRLVKRYGAELLKVLEGTTVEALVEQRITILETVRDKFGDVPYWNSTLGTAAKGQLFEVERLQVGMVAPEIQGDDLDGVDFKLSDYRGQVVFLDFWGDW